MKIHEALTHVMEDVQAVAKTDRNTSQGFNFRGIDAVVNAVAPALRKHGVLVMPVVDSYSYSTVEVGRNKTAMGHVIVKVRYVFVGPEGDNLYTEVFGEAMDSGDKAMPKAMSVAFRTALLQALALPTDEQDPDASSYERTGAPEKVQKPSPSSAQVTAWSLALDEAPDMETLDAIASEAATYELVDTDRAGLREIYTRRKNEMTGAGA